MFFLYLYLLIQKANIVIGGGVCNASLNNEDTDGFFIAIN